MKKIQIAVVLLVAYTSASAAPTWPTLDNQWTPVMYGGSLYVDALTNDAADNHGTPPQSPLDIVGGIDPEGGGPFAAGFWSNNGTDLMFRMRVDGNPSVGGQFVWTTLLNMDADTDVDWALQLDLSGDNQVELVQALSGGPDNGWDVTLADAPHSVGFSASDYSRFSTVSGVVDPPYTGSQFHGPGPIGNDYFVDIAVPLATFSSTTGWNTGDPLDIAFSSSSTHTSSNKDRPDYDAWGPADDPDHPTVPAPGAALLVAIGGAGLSWMRRTKRV